MLLKAYMINMNNNRRCFIKNALLAGGSLLIAESGSYATELPLKEIPESSGTLQDVIKTIRRSKLEKSVLLATRWLTDIAQIQTIQPDADECVVNYSYQNWKGAIKGEFSSESKWKFFGTVWHTGQAVKALSLAYKYFREPYLLESAQMAAEFILNQQQTNKNDADFGMILAYEDKDGLDKINTSCVLECCDGLFTLSEVSGDNRYADRAVEAISWVVRKMYSGGCFIDRYSPQDRTVKNVWKNKYDDPGRPLLDDGVLLKAWKYSGREEFRRVFYEIADHLLKREEPRGNWFGYAPCNWKEQSMHPRQAFWWGRPLWMAYKDSGKTKYRDAFNRACQWYTKAMRHDGGMIRRTYTDFSTDSFGHATSATSCAVMMFRDAYTELGDPQYIPYITKGLSYAMAMQVTEAHDPRMKGVIIEKCLPPGGKDGVPWAVRDIGVSFFITAACQILLDTRDPKS
jgi:hypothetical protein